MALKTSMWLSGAAAACALVAVAYLPPKRAVRPNEEPPIALQRAAAERRLRNAVQGHGIEAARDGLVRLSETGDSTTFIFAGTGADDTIARRLVLEDWALAGAARPAIRPAVLFVDETTIQAGSLPIRPAIDLSLLPAATGGHLCAALVRPFPVKAVQRRYWRQLVRRALGPCALLRGSARRDRRSSAGSPRGDTILPARP